MTRLLLDVAIYQGMLKPADVKRAGFTAVNLKISHGLSRKNVHPQLGEWIDECRALGLGISTFHYLTADATGTAQADYAYSMLGALGLLYGTAHQLDVESTPVPPLSSVRGYLDLMTTLLGRPVVLYTGDWWWTARPAWNVSDLTPYLWAAPNRGYIGSYPGDTSADWRAGYGGWPNLSVMQYAVQPLSFPDGSRGTIDVSKSAIRDESVWRDLTIGRPGVSYAPQSLKDARTFVLETVPGMDPLSVGIVGDDSHAASGTSYHLGKDALKSGSYSVAESSRDSKPTNAAMALDIGWFSIKVGSKTHTLRDFSRWLVAECAAGAPDTKDIREVIYSLDGSTVKRWDRLGKRTTGDSSHTSHTHESWFRDSEARDKTAHLRRWFIEIGYLEDPDMAISDEDIAKIVKATWAYDPGNNTTGAVNGGMQLPGWEKAGDNVTANPAWGLSRAVVAADVAYQVRDRVDRALDALAKVLANVTADDGEAQQVISEIREAQAQTVADVLGGLGGSTQSDAEVAAALTSALGPRAAAVAALMG